MALRSGTHPIGPETGPLHLRTGRDGVAARAGHDLLIEMRSWSGSIEVSDGDPLRADVAVEVALDSFEVLQGYGGVVPLSERDRADITANALRMLDASAHPVATFTSTRVVTTDLGGTVDGDLTVRGETRPLTFDVVPTGPASWQATARVLQSAFGIEPYRALFGALRLADSVRIEVTVDPRSR
jgi:polyisoprenoid-binding protein YceI